jgi:hypothetical protein
MLLLIYRNGTTLFRHTSRREEQPSTFTEDEIVVQHEDTLTKGQMMSKQKQITVKHSFEFISTVNGYHIYAEIE